MSVITRFGQVPNPQKTFNVPLNIGVVMESIKMIPEVSDFKRDNTDGAIMKRTIGRYTLKESNDFLKQVVIHSKETLSMGSNITIQLEDVDENKTKVNIEISRELGSFDEPSELQQANNDMKQVTSIISALCNPEMDWKEIILKNC